MSLYWSDSSENLYNGWCKHRVPWSSCSECTPVRRDVSLRPPDSDAKDATITDLKARLRLIRKLTPSGGTLDRATDLRVKNWRKP